MLTVKQFADWLESLSSEDVRQMELPDRVPDRVVVALPTGGLSLRVSGALDAPTFQILTRAASSPDAEALAFDIDRIIVDMDKPLSIGDVWVTDAGRVGGRPYLLDRDDRRRVIYTCNYWVESERA